MAWYQSSTGQGVSLTIKGIVTALLPVAMYFAKQHNWQISETEIWDFVNAVLTAISAITIAYGLARKAYIYLTKK